MDLAGIGQAVGSVGDFAKSLVNHFLPETMSDGEKAKAQLELQALISNRETAVINSQKEIIVAELTQADNYTKRARPTIIYGGLLFIFLNHVAFPIVAFFTGRTMPAIALPPEFWLTWGGVCGIYVWSRTREKLSEPGLIGTIKGAM